jgi:hypothetical protein
MQRALAAALALASLAGPARAVEWTERYFGVGSAGEETEACGQARDHAQGNSFRACLDRRGKRGEAEYTECTCAAASERMHVCNVNLKVRCDGASESSSAGSQPSRGEPKGRAGNRRQAIARRLRPGPEVQPEGRR